MVPSPDHKNIESESTFEYNIPSNVLLGFINSGVWWKIEGCVAQYIDLVNFVTTLKLLQYEL